MTERLQQPNILTKGLKDIFRNARRLSGMIWKEKRGSFIALVVVFLLVSSAPFVFSGSRGLLINELVSAAGGSEVSSSLLLFTIVLIASTFIPSFLLAIQNYLSTMFWFFLEQKFETLVIAKKGELDVAVHESPKHRDLFNRVSEDGTWRVRNFVDRQFYLFQNLIEVGITSVILIFFNGWVFFVILLGTIPELIVELRYGRNVWGIHTGRAETKRRYWELHSHFERLPSLIELKLFQNIPSFLTSIKALFAAFQAEEKKNDQRKLLYQLIVLCFSQAVIAFAVVYYILDVVHGNMQIGTFTFVLTSIGDLRLSMSSLFTNLGRQYQDNLFVSDLFQLLDLKTVIAQPKRGVRLSSKKTPTISFDHVTFSYPETTQTVLKDFSLEIAAGEKIALVGVNGAGKTTLVKLLCRFYDPSEGRILIDGNDLKTIDLATWYDQIGAIFQDYARYHFIVAEAIALGRRSHPASMAKVKTAAQASEADLFIEEWEKKYEQMLGKEFSEGVEPSIGQWQKLALAKTFYRDPRVLILDEPTSAIDAESEAKIFEKLEQLPKDRTVLLISHRFSTVRQADQIAVIENGMLMENGNHEQLLKQNGTYARLFHLQAKGYQ